MDNRIYKAPSIPKINRTTIASPFTRGGVSSSGIRLKRSSFSFIRPIKRQIDPEKLAQPAVEQTNFIGKELAETNRVLVEIQKQLSLDFGYRIAEEKKAIALEKKRISSRRVSDKESRLEKGPKGVLGRTFDAVTAPFKSIFQKLIDFFSIILTGILMNTAFEWLGKKENQAKVKAFFDFVTEYWKELLIIFAAYKLLKLVKAIAGVANTLRRMLKWFKSFKSPIKPPTPPTTPGIKPIKPSLKSPLERGKGQAPIPRPAPPKPILGPTGRPAITDPLSRYKGSGSAPARAPGIPRPGQGITPTTVSSPQPKGKVDLSKFTGGGLRIAGKFLRAIGLAFLADEISKDYEKGDYKAIAVKLSAYGLGWLTTSLLATGGLVAAGTGVGTVPGVAIVGSSVLAGAGVDAGVRAAFGYSQGGTVGQGDRAGTDTVPAQSGFGKMFLDAGEEVIRTSEAMRWRPLLKDINDNAGRMWQQFTQAVIKLMDITGIQKDNAEIFKQVLENYNNFLKDQIQKMKLKELENVGGGMGGGTGGMPSSYATSAPMSAPSLPNISLNLNKEGDSPQVNLSPTVINASISAPQSSAKLTPVTPIVNNFILDSSSNNKSTFTEINLPPQVINNTPKVPTYSAKSNEVPNIIPFDFLNPWMTKESIGERYGVAYGI